MVDGPFVEAERNLELRFRGSANQRVLDVPASLAANAPVWACLLYTSSVGLSMLRVLTGISIYWIVIPGYLLALGLTFFVPKIFTGIAFDSGGVASGPMTSTFLLPFAMGACEALSLIHI